MKIWKEPRAWLPTVILLIALPAAALGEDFPQKNIRWIVTYSPGGGFDLMSRAVARSMKKYLPSGVNIVIKNISGGGGRTGAITLYRSKPDGYTVGILDIGGLIVPQMVNPSKILYDVAKFTYLARVANEPFTIFVAAKSRFKALEDLKKVDRLTWGSEGIGTGRWLPSFLTASNLGLKFDVVGGYRGTGESLPALIRGDFNAWVNPSDHPSVVPLLESGDIRCVIHMGETRSKACPNTPTAKEVGIEAVVEILRLIAGPPGLPPDRAKKLEDLLVKAMNDDEFKAWVKKSGSLVNPGNAQEAQRSLDQFAGLVKKEQAQIREMLGGK